MFVHACQFDWTRGEVFHAAMSIHSFLQLGFCFPRKPYTPCPHAAPAIVLMLVPAFTCYAHAMPLAHST